MFDHRIQLRIIFLFVILVVSIITLGGWALHWMIRQSLEAELGLKLSAVARAASVQFGEEEIGYLFQSIGRRTEQRLRQRLLQLKEVTDVKRIYIFDQDSQSLIDTEADVPRFERYFNLQFHQTELRELNKNRSAYSILFEGIDGQPTMTGFAPLIQGDAVVGGVGVDGSVPFLAAMGKLRRRLYTIGFAGTILATLLGLLLASSITKPIGRLVRASEKIGHGEYDDPIEPVSRDEVGLLARTMEEMRQRILERERELKAMLAGVAHEIRNPLGGIELFTGLLLDETSDNRKARIHIERISKEVANLKEIVDNFLSYARPQKPQPQVCRLSEMINETSMLLADQMQTHGIVITTPERIGQDTVWVDPKHLKQILLNLVQNAIQAMRNGGSIDFQWLNKNNAVVLTMTDTGEGIPEEMQDNIFVPFFTTREQGTGLGLPIVKGLVEVNGGTIGLTRSDARGSVFKIRLPKG